MRTKKACFHFVECSLSYAKIVQTRTKENLFLLCRVQSIFYKSTKKNEKKTLFYFTKRIVSGSTVIR